MVAVYQSLYLFVLTADLSTPTSLARVGRVCLRRPLAWSALSFDFPSLVACLRHRALLPSASVGFVSLRSGGRGPTTNETRLGEEPAISGSSICCECFTSGAGSLELRDLGDVGVCAGGDFISNFEVESTCKAPIACTITFLGLVDPEAVFWPEATLSPSTEGFAGSKGGIGGAAGMFARPWDDDGTAGAEGAPGGLLDCTVADCLPPGGIGGAMGHSV